MKYYEKSYGWPYGVISTTFLLTPIILSFALAMDIYMPMLPEMRKLLNTTPEMVQLTLSIYFFVGGFGQLIVGPLSDAYGRYKILIISSILFFIGSISCAFSNIEWLLFFRFIEAVGACGMFVTAFAMVRDVFSGKNTAIIYSLLNAMIAISPIMGPIIGVFIAAYFSWHVVFYFLAAFGVCTFLVIIFFISETCPIKEREGFSLGIFSRYLTISRNITFWAYTIPAMVAVSAFFSMFSITPYIINACGGDRSDIIPFFGMAGVGYMLGSIFSSFILGKIGVLKTSFLGSSLLFLSSILLFVVYLIDGLSLLGFYGPMVVATFGGALTAGSGASGALEPFSDCAGAASAMFGAIELGGSAIIGAIICSFSMITPLPLALSMLSGSILSMLLLVLLIKSK